MAGRRYVLIALSLAALQAARAVDPAASPASPAPRDADIETMRRTFESLTPEQRQRFRDNFQRWMNLTPEEKKELREREEMRRIRIEEETAHAIKELGLNLNSEEYERFARRYAEERRAIELKLQETRKPLVRDMLSRLRQEFAAKPSP